MSQSGSTLDQAYFDTLYANDPDPWQFKSSPYEDAKYADTVATLPQARYPRALEVGCSIGELTYRLAPRCTALEALDIAEAALDQARRRNVDYPQVHFHRMIFPHAVPDGTFDLVMLSEVLYFLSDDDLLAGARLVRERTAPGGDVVMVHWLGATPEFPSNGDRASEAFIAAVQPMLTIARQSRHEHYRIDLLHRPA